MAISSETVPVDQGNCNVSSTVPAKQANDGKGKKQKKSKKKSNKQALQYITCSSSDEGEKTKGEQFANKLLGNPGEKVGQKIVNDALLQSLGTEDAGQSVIYLGK